MPPAKLNRFAMNVSLRAKFLLLSALVQALALGLLIWNSLRLMDQAVRQNTERLAQEYAMTLDLSLGPYASSGRLAELDGYFGAMLAKPGASVVRYIAVLDAQQRPLLRAGAVPPDLAGLTAPATGPSSSSSRSPTPSRSPSRSPAPSLYSSPASPGISSNQHSPAPQAEQNAPMQTVLRGAMLHARHRLRLQGQQVGTLYFGLSTGQLTRARDDVLRQGSLISLAALGVGLLLYFWLTVRVGRRLDGLTGQARRLAQGDYNSLLPEQGGDEIEIVSRSLNTMNLALRERIGQLDDAEHRLHESESRFQTLFQMAPVPLAVSDPQGVLITVNLALLRTLGAAAEHLVGQRWSQIAAWHPSDRRRVLARHQRGASAQGELVRITLPDGGLGSMALWSSSLMLGGTQAIIWALLDVSAELHAEQALKELNATLENRVRQRSAELEQANADLSAAVLTLQRTQHELLAAEKMASLGALVAGVAHELNTPIGNSLLAATTLAERVGQFRQLVEQGSVRRSVLQAHLDETGLASRLISGALHKAADLIASFKQVAADQASDQRRVFDLLAVLQDTLATYGPRLQRAGCVAILAVPPGMTFDSCPGSLYQVLNNLISNALVHGFEGRSSGNIAVGAAEAEQGMIELVFRDDGVGMPAPVLKRVFDPFFTTKMGQGGTGLGMNIVYNIVTGVLGGRIAIDTAPGQGTTVRMLIPRIAPRRAPPLD